MTVDQGITIAIVGALGLILAALVPLLVKQHKAQHSAEAAAHEVRPNGGTSMADAVNRIESRLILQSQRQERDEARLERHLEQAAIESTVIEQLVDIITRGGQSPTSPG